MENARYHCFVGEVSSYRATKKLILQLGWSAKKFHILTHAELSQLFKQTTLLKLKILGEYLVEPYTVSTLQFDKLF
jgi:hypothetical protein